MEPQYTWWEMYWVLREYTMDGVRYLAHPLINRWEASKRERHCFHERSRADDAQELFKWDHPDARVIRVLTHDEAKDREAARALRERAAIWATRMLPATPSSAAYNTAIEHIVRDLRHEAQRRWPH